MDWGRTRASVRRKEGLPGAEVQRGAPLTTEAATEGAGAKVAVEAAHRSRRY